MKEKEEIKYRYNSIIENLVVCTTAIASICIVYTIFWYAKISYVTQMSLNETEDLYSYEISEQEDLGRIIIENKDFTNLEEFSEAEAYGREPKLVVKSKKHIGKGEYEYCKKYYYSTELGAKTIFSYYNEDFENVSVNGNVITWIWK